MSYTRLTDKNDLYWALQETKLSAEVGIYLTDCLNRLAELEDKIEQGTLIERPPIKKGDSIWLIRKEWDYFAGKTKKSIERRCVDKIFLNNDNSFTISTILIEKGIKHRSIVKSRTFTKSWFLTREEAEKRLKEIQK